jgi:pilus assembly protein FimV
MPFTAYAAGLGKLSVISGLGEPLNAEIELVSVTPEELSTLSAAIAPDEAYAIQGMERTALHRSIRIETTKRPNGTPILKLSTSQRVSDPFLSMLIQVDWPTGRLLREYTALLDPPGYNAGAADNTSPAVGSVPLTDSPSQIDVIGQGASPSNRSMATPDASAVIEEHETRNGDTLSSIAQQMQVEGVSLDQMLVGIYQANKEAFSGNNMNRLKVGQIIRAPSPEELQGISQQEATAEIRVQAADWNAYRNKLAGLVAEAPAANDDADSQSSGGKITAPAEDQAALPANGPRDVVKLSKSDTAANGDKSTAQALQDKLAALQEENIAKEKSAQEANERTAALEKQIADMQQLLAVKNQALADMQKNAGTAAATPSPTTPVTPDTAPVDVAPPVPSATDAPVVNGTPAAADPAEAAKPAATVDKPKKKIIMPPPAPIEEPSLIDEVLNAVGENATLLAGLIGALILSAIAWLFLRNKRKRGLDSFEQGILTSGGLKANTVFGNTSGDTVDTGDTSFLTDFSQSPGGMIDTHDVDPIAEAEVYMAYGRESQAEEILKDAIAKEPKRYELHLKLLEIFAGRNDSSAFEAVAGELYSTLGSNDPIWAKVAQMGHKMEPENPLYDISTSGAAVVSAAAATQKLDASDFADAEVMTESSLDFSLDADSNIGQASENVGQTDSSLDFDLGSAQTIPGEESPADVAGSSSGPATTAFTNTENDIGSMDTSLDFPEQSLQTQILDNSSDKTEESFGEFGQTLPGADTASFETSGFESVGLEPVESGDLDMPEIGMPISAPAPDLPEEIMFETPAIEQTEEESGLDFNFDMGVAETPAETPLGEPDFADISMKPASEEIVENNTPEINLSDISFDMDTEANPITEVSGISESEDVNTKLDLVTAYIDMGDKEGARELLDEVLKEGGIQQRERAQQMLSSLA